MNRPYEGVFFDLDGTVIDSLQDLTNAVNHTMVRFGLETFPPEAVRQNLGWGAARLLRRLVPQADEAEQAALLADYRPYYAAHATDLSAPYPGVIPMLEGLKARGLVLAIVSNKPDNAVRPLTNRFFSDLVALAVGEAPGIRPKPAPDMLRAAADRLGLDLARCLYVGDSEVDLQTAANAGMDCVSVSWGFRDRDQLLAAGARRIIDDPAELLAIAAAGTILPGEG